MAARTVRLDDDMKILLPDSIDLDPELPDGVTAARYDIHSPIPAEHLDAEVLVDWGYSRRKLADAASRMANLRLVQALSAGADGALAAPFGPHVAICSGVGLHDGPVTEHALALILSLLRRLPACHEAQKQHVWSDDLGGMQTLGATGHVDTLLGTRVLVWGFGSIAQTLAPLLSAMGAHVRGVARSAGSRGGFDVVTEAELSRELPLTDLLVMILPGTPATAAALAISSLTGSPSCACTCVRSSTEVEVAAASSAE